MKLDDKQRQLLKDYTILMEEGAKAGVIDMGFYHALTNIGRKKIIEQFKNNPNREKRDYISKAFVKTAYQYILDNGGTVDQALDYSIELLEKSRDWWDTLKNKEFYDSKEIMSDMQEHPKQKQMLKEGTMDKVVMNQSRSANQFLRRAAKCVGVSDIIAGIRYDLVNTSDQLMQVTAANVVNQHDIDGLYEYIGIPKKDKKFLAKVLRDKGFKNETIANTLDISISTLKRYLREFPK